MKTREDILRVLEQHKRLVRERFSVKRLGLFGSWSRGTAGSGSDIDILVEFESPSFDRYMDLKFFLEEALQAEVDLVMADALKPRLKPIVEKEVVYA